MAILNTEMNFRITQETVISWPEQQSWSYHNDAASLRWWNANAVIMSVQGSVISKLTFIYVVFLSAALKQQLTLNCPNITLIFPPSPPQLRHLSCSTGHFLFSVDISLCPVPSANLPRFSTSRTFLNLWPPRFCVKDSPPVSECSVCLYINYQLDALTIIYS